MPNGHPRQTGPQVSTMKKAERETQLLTKGGVVPPLPARYETTEGGFKLRVRAANPLTKDWRANYKAADAGSVPAVEVQRPAAPIAYGVPKPVLERQPDEPLDSAPYAPE